MNFETLAVHAAKDIDPATGAIVPPLHLSTTFGRDENLALLGPSQYVREGNPTQDVFERAMAAVEGGALGMAFSSGSAASTAVLQALPQGSVEYGVAGRVAKIAQHDGVGLGQLWRA